MQTNHAMQYSMHAILAPPTAQHINIINIKLYKLCSCKNCCQAQGKLMGYYYKAKQIIKLYLHKFWH